MDIFSKTEDMVRAIDRVPRPLGLVPTMGYLHSGHLSMIHNARKENKTVVVSIFVNPIQFNASEDLGKYPRDLDRDLSMLQDAGVDIVFNPVSQEMYPEGYSTFVDVESVSGILEGKHRPGHFRGVATVVTKLFTIVRPDRAYFGQKDGQQTILIKRLNEDLNLGADIIVVPTVRESDGLAMSSRNVYLSKDERNAAVVLFNALCRVYELWKQDCRDAKILREAMRSMIIAEPLAKLEYVSIADSHTLEELENVDRGAIVSVAAIFGNARLIDNILLG